MGGLIGRSEGDVTITDSEKTDTYGAQQTKVTKGTSFLVTKLETTPPVDNSDNKQGRVGLYIGSAGNLAVDTEDGQQAVNPAEPVAIVINVTYNGPADNFAAADGSLADEGKNFIDGTVKINGVDTDGIFYYSRSYTFPNNDRDITMYGQNLIGMSGFEPNTKPVIINGKQYFIAKVGDNILSCTNPLYFILFKGHSN